MINEPIRAAVISDTHGLLRPEVEHILQTCDMVIHAGDFDNQMIFHKLNISRPLYTVRGNNDGSWADQLPLIRKFTLNGVRFLMVHDRSDLPGDLGDAQIVIFGHSHMPYCRKQDGRLWLNPGSCGYRRFALPLSLNVLTLSCEGCIIETFWLKENGDKLEIQKETSRFTECVNHASADTKKSRDNIITDTKRDSRRKSRKTGERSGVCQKLGEVINRKRKEYTDNVQGKAYVQDQLFLVAKIMRLMKHGQPVDWVAGNLQVEPDFVETVYRICVTHPGVNAHQILDKMEVNRIFEHS